VYGPEVGEGGPELELEPIDSEGETICLVASRAALCSGTER
jgi:hypothetical protein